MFVGKLRDMLSSLPPVPSERRDDESNVVPLHDPTAGPPPAWDATWVEIARYRMKIAELDRQKTYLQRELEEAQRQATETVARLEREIADISSKMHDAQERALMMLSEIGLGHQEVAP